MAWVIPRRSAACVISESMMKGIPVRLSSGRTATRYKSSSFGCLMACSQCMKPNGNSLPPLFRDAYAKDGMLMPNPAKTLSLSRMMLMKSGSRKPKNCFT